MTQIPTPAEMVTALEASGNFRVLRRFESRAVYRDGQPPAERLGIGVILDTETTGRDSASDKIIELGMVKFSFDRETGEVYAVLDSFNALEDPGMPIDPTATAVNGITDEMVRGQRIDDAPVEAFLADVEIVIAHNASFDRDFCERRFPIFKDTAWACSRVQIPWDAEKVGGQKLDYIAFRFGFYYSAHRAEEDCRALLEVLASALPESKVPALKRVLEVYRTEEKRLWAIGAPFDVKDMLRARGYRWGDGTNGAEKAWNIQIPLSAFDDEITWLRANIYGKPFPLIVDTVNALNRFSARRQGKENLRF